MTMFSSRLFLNRLIVSCDGERVYDETFHKGINIIRGRNSSGKSTIADFIFFILGGDIAEWKPEAKKCDYVIAELNINDAIISVKRAVTDKPRQPMAIYLGKLENAIKSQVEGWQQYSFMRSTQKDSFSQILFKVLDFPEVKNEESNLTMHQILRLIYVDQMSPPDALMRPETFDTPITRTAIGDLLLGVYDDTLYQAELDCRDKEKELEKTGEQFSKLLEVLNAAEQEVDFEVITADIEKTQKEQTELENKIKKIQTSNDKNLGEDALKRLEDARRQFVELKGKLAQIQNDAEKMEFEAEDSRLFVASLKSRLKSLEESVSARNAIEELPLTHCPKCLSILNVPDDEKTCALCKQPCESDTEKSQILRMKQELSHQIKESEQLLKDKEKYLADLMGEIPELKRKARLAQKNFYHLSETGQPRREEELDALLFEKGSFDSKLNFLYKQAKAVGILEKLKQQQAKLAQEVKSLKIAIQIKKSRQSERVGLAMSRIEAYALDLLKNDLDLEEAFKIASSIQVNFSKNTFGVDNRNQFSASSTIYLKNSVLFAIFFSSLELSSFRYPRFILCDNIEDKGMEEIRSQHFQRLITTISEKFTVGHQIIITTSMIDPQLDNPIYCVGEKYTQENKSLKMNGVLKRLKE